MPRRSKLDEHADWLIMRANQPNGKIAKEFTETFKTSVTDDAIRRWFITRNKTESRGAIKKSAEDRIRVTAELLEGEWGDQLVEIRDGLKAAKETGDERARLAYIAAWQRQLEMLLKAWQPTIIMQQQGKAPEADILAVFDKWLET